MRLEGRTALVTGASSGLGAHFAGLLAAAGANVVLGARRADRLAEVVETIEAAGGRALAVPMDVTDEASVIAAYDAAAERFGPVDAVVANAGLNIAGPVLDVDVSAIDAIMAVNVRGVFLTVREGARRMIAAGSRQSGRGRVVIVSSITASSIGPGLGLYGASKAASLQLGRTLARDWSKKGVNVNILCPGYTETELNSDWFHTDGGRRQIAKWPRARLMNATALDAMLRELTSHGIRAERLVGAGHSEGSVVVSRLAASERGKHIDAVVLLAGPSVGILEIMREQSGVMLLPEHRDEGARALDEAIAYVRRGERPPAELGGQPFGAGALVNMPDEALRYMREVDATDPVAVARTILQPTLVVQGGDDSSVPTHHGERLRDALLERELGASKTSYLFIPGITHMFKVVPPDVVGPAAFGYPGPVDQRVPDGIDRWTRGLRQAV